MRKRVLVLLTLLAYTAILVKVMVFKDIPTIHIGQMMLNFAGTDTGHGPNFMPFATIVPYLFGFKGLIIAGINLVGNIILLVPLGFLLPLLFPNISWKKALILAVLSGLAIEMLQVVLRVGIFDIDDVILNAFGFMLGYLALKFLAKWMRAKQYWKITITVLAIIIAALAAFYFIYPWGQPVTPDIRATEENGVTQTNNGTDPCGGTGGNGEIVSIGSNSFTLALDEGGSNLIVNLRSHATIETSNGSASLSDLKIGDRVTLVGDNNRDGTFTADAVVLCGIKLQ